MRDINTSLQRAYYEALQATGDEYWAGEEPDDHNENLYGVISTITSNDRSTKNSTDVQAAIQISLHAKKAKFNNTVDLNAAVNRMYAAVKTQPDGTLNMDAYNIQMLNLTVQSDIEQSYGRLGANIYVSRVIIFNQILFIK